MDSRIGNGSSYWTGEVICDGVVFERATIVLLLELYIRTYVAFIVLQLVEENASIPV